MFLFGGEEGIASPSHPQIELMEMENIVIGTCLWRWGATAQDVWLSCATRDKGWHPMRDSATTATNRIKLSIWKRRGLLWDRLQRLAGITIDHSHQCVRTSHVRNIFGIVYRQCYIYLDSRVQNWVPYLCRLTILYHCIIYKYNILLQVR